jgi:hypothetical protein
VRAGEVATAVSRRIDYVLVRAGRHGALLQVMHCERLLDGPVDSVWASDHYGVIADLFLPEHHLVRGQVVPCSGTSCGHHDKSRR